jgi:hypothetical protein
MDVGDLKVLEAAYKPSSPRPEEVSAVSADTKGLAADDPSKTGWYPLQRWIKVVGDMNIFSRDMVAKSPCLLTTCPARMQIWLEKKTGTKMTENPKIIFK